MVQLSNLVVSLDVCYLLLELFVLLFLKNTLVLDGHYLNEVLDVTVSVVEHAACQGRTCVQVVLTDELEQFFA